MLDFGEGFAVLLCGNGSVPLLDCAVPVGGREFQASRLLVEIAQVLLHGRIRTHMRGRFVEVIFGEIILAQLEIRPAYGIQVRRIVRLKRERLFNQVERLFQLHAAIGVHIAQVIQGGSSLRIGRRSHGQHFLEFDFSRVKVLLTLVKVAAQEQHVRLVIGLSGDLFRLS